MSSSSSVTQQRKVALIIGNQNYQQLPKLQVTLKDGEAVNELLKKLGFKTHLFLDQTKKQMNSEINEFGNEIIQENDLVFFYYSGHGGQFFRDYTVHNVLCGIDATTNHDGVSLATILTRYFQKKSVYFIILDECQSFPKTLEECITKSKGGSSALQEIPLITSAMPQIPRGKEVEILFACKPDKGAFEEQEQNLGHIVRALQDAVIKVDRWDDVNKYIIKQVKEETDNRQTPVVQTSITQPLYIRQVNTQPPQSDPTEPSNLNLPSSSAAPLRPSQVDMTLQDAIQIFQTQGKLENARIKLTDSLQVFTNKLYGEGQYINFEYLGKSFSFKDVTFEYPNTTELPAYILLKVNDGQQWRQKTVPSTELDQWSGSMVMHQQQSLHSPISNILE